LRDPSIQDVLLRNPKPLSPRAYLALYLAVLTKRIHGLTKTQQMPPRERFLHDYLHYLPSYQDFATFHPILVHYEQNEKKQDNDHSTTVTHDLPASRFYTDHLIYQLRQQIEHEYHTLCLATLADSGQVIQLHNKQDTVSYISWQEYITARLQVQTRSFTAGPLSKYDLSVSELHVFGQHLLLEAVPTGIVGGPTSSSKEDAIRTALSSAMVPLLDAFNHQVSPNIGWKYLVGNSHIDGSGGGFGAASISSSNTSIFTVFAAADVPGGVPLYDTYGTTTPDSRYV
jgi:hypothetical protein